MLLSPGTQASATRDLSGASGSTPVLKALFACELGAGVESAVVGARVILWKEVRSHCTD